MHLVLTSSSLSTSFLFLASLQSDSWAPPTPVTSYPPPTAQCTNILHRSQSLCGASTLPSTSTTPNSEYAISNMVSHARLGERGRAQIDDVRKPDIQTTQALEGLGGSEEGGTQRGQ